MNHGKEMEKDVSINGPFSVAMLSNQRVTMKNGGNMRKQPFQ